MGNIQSITNTSQVSVLKSEGSEQAIKDKTYASIFNRQKTNIDKGLSYDEKIATLYKEIELLETQKKASERAKLKENATPENIQKAQAKVHNVLDKKGSRAEYLAIDKLTDEEIVLAFSDKKMTEAVEKEFRFFIDNRQGLGKLHQRLIETSEKYGVAPYGGKDRYIKTTTPEIAKLYGTKPNHNNRDEEVSSCPHYRMYNDETNYAELFNKMSLEILK